MSSKHLRGDTNYAWPTAEVAVMGAKVVHFQRLLHFHLYSIDKNMMPVPVVWH